MSDESRFPTDEVSALVYKMLLQHCVEMDHLDDMLKRHEAGEEMEESTEQARITEAQRQVHLEFVKRFPGYKYASELSYAFNREDDTPQIIAVDIDGHPGDFKDKHDFVRDEIIHQMMERIFKYHTRVFEDGTYEFCWEFSGHEYDVTYKQLPNEGQLIH